MFGNRFNPFNPWNRINPMSPYNQGDDDSDSGYPQASYKELFGFNDPSRVDKEYLICYSNQYYGSFCHKTSYIEIIFWPVLITIVGMILIQKLFNKVRKK